MAGALPTTFCTTATLPQLPYARALAERLAEHHPGCRVIIATRPEDAGGEPRPDLDPGVALKILRPVLLRQALAGGGPAVFLDCAHELLAPLDPLLDRLASARVVAGLRCRELPPDGRRPDAEDLRALGRLDPGIVAVAPGAEKFLEVWTSWAAEAAPRVPGRGLVAAEDDAALALERALTDAAEERPEGVETIADPTVAASPWNLHEHPPGTPLRALALPGFRPDRPHLLAPRATRVTPSADLALDAIAATYARRLREHGWHDAARRADVGRPLPGGLIFSDRLSRMLAEAAAAGHGFGDVFAPTGARAFEAWFRSDEDVPGRAAGLTRYLLRVYRDRRDLPRVYPNLDGADGPEFAAWCWVYGEVEMDIPRALLPPRPAHLGPAPLGPPSAVEVCGYFNGTLGLGEAARGYVRAFEAAGVGVHTTVVDPGHPADAPPVAEGYGRRAFAGSRADAPPAANVLCVNPDQLPRFATELGESFFRGRPNIGVFAWETDRVPRRWAAAYRYVDEIWVYSSYVAEHLGRAAPVPVVVVPPPVEAPRELAPHGLPLPDGFRFLVMFDLFSTIQRKNPLGAIEAFMRAFAPGEGPYLVVKSIHAGQRRAEYEQLLYAARDRPDIVFADLSLEPAAKDGLLADCDCLVSLHRSEGFGLPLAESMALGKPVVATAYSGNLDFMTAANSFLVGHTLVPVGADVEIYPAEGLWAEPDLDEAAQRLRTVWENQMAAKTRGAQGARDVAAMLGPKRIGELARDRLAVTAEVYAARAAPAEPVPPPAAERPSVLRRLGRRLH